MKDMKRNTENDMEHEKNPHHDSGFFFGFLVGILAMFLFGTKKGRELLHTMTNEGSEKLTSWKETMQEDFLEDEREDETDFIPASPIGSPVQHEKYPTQGRKFFRRQKKIRG